MAETRETRAFASEIKFVVDPAVADRVRVWARQHLQPDPHGGGTHGDEYRTTSLYFDTPALDVLNRRGSYGRAKFRVRRYADRDVVFLERKLRTGRWMTRRLAVRRLAPVCQVAYRRMARGVEAAAGHARLTLDEAIHVTAVNGLRFSAAVGVPVLPASQILELKFRTHLPAVFTRLVEEFGLMPQTASKYRLSMAALHQHASQPASAGLDPVSARDAHA
jgi:hypothetical protein